MSNVKLWLFGPPRLERDGIPIEINRRKSMALLIYLAVTQQPHSRNALATLLWPEADQSRGRSILRRALSDLRKALNKAYLQVEGDTIALLPEADLWVDIHAFRSLAAVDQRNDSGTNADCETAIPRLREAVDLYRDDFLSGFTLPDSFAFDEWQLFQTEGLQRELAAALAHLIDCYIAQEKFEAALPYAQRWVSLDPLLERPHRILMQLYAWSDRRITALRQYQQYIQILQDEFGEASPSEEFISTFEAIKENRLAPPAPISATAVVSADGPAPSCPYQGLFAFREEDAPFFFGREQFVQRLVAAVNVRPLAAIIGPSGSGKSSALFAGLLAHLKSGISLDSESTFQTAAQHWLVTDCRPGAHPFLALAMALLPLLQPDLSETERLVETSKLAKALRQKELQLFELIEQISQKQVSSPRVLLAVDQFEELYTLCPEPDTRQSFAEALLDTIRVQQFRAEPNFVLVLTLRADFMGQALAHRPFADILQDNTFILGPMSPAELSQAIEFPAERQGVTFEAGLVERLLEDVGDEPGNLPLLEFALTALWEHQQKRLLTHEAYEAIGRVEGALAHYANQVYAQLTETEQQRARHVFLQLVRPGQRTEDTRRLAIRSELSQDWPLVRRLADTRLVVTGRNPAGSETVEIVHEALIHGWERLRDWLEADRTFRIWQERLRASVRQWESSGQDEGALLRGATLAEAEQWLADRGEALSQVEREFIEASLSLQEQKQQEQRRTQAARDALRRRIMVGLIIGIGSTLILAGLAAWQWRRVEVQRNIALEAQAVAATERDQARVALSRQLATQVLSLLDDRLDQALLLSVSALHIADTVEARSSLHAALEYRPRLLQFLHGHTAEVKSLALSPDGRLLASGSADQTVLVWDMETGRQIGPPLEGHSGEVNSVAFSPDGRIIASASADHSLILWNASIGRPIGLPLTSHTGSVNSVAFSPDGAILASGSDDRTIILWDISALAAATSEDEQLELVIRPLGRPLREHTGGVLSVAFSPDGRQLASGGKDNLVVLWDISPTLNKETASLSTVSGGQPQRVTLTGHTRWINSLAFSPDGRSLASGSWDSTIKLWDVPAEISPRAEEVSARTLTGYKNGVFVVTFNRDGRTLASAGDFDGKIMLWDLDSGQPLDIPLVGPPSRVNTIAFQPRNDPVSDDSGLITGGANGKIIIWDISERSQSPLGQTLAWHADSELAVAFSPDGQILASGGEDDVVRLWDLASGQALGQPLAGHTADVLSLAFSPDGQTLASGSLDRTVRLWDPVTGRQLGEPLSENAGAVWSVTFSPDGKTLASGGEDRTVILWDLASQQPLHDSPLRGYTGYVRNIAFSPDGQIVAAAGSFDGTINLWDVQTGELAGAPLDGHTDRVWDLAFSPDGRLMVSGDNDGVIKLWDFAARELIDSLLTSHTGGVYSLAFSPDGQAFASGDGSGRIILWDVATWQPLGPPMRGRTDRVWSLAFSPDSQTVASANENGGIILWNVNVKAWQALACRRANRNLSAAEWAQFFGDQPYQKPCPELP